MRIGFIGAGVMAQTFGRHLTGAGHEIVVSNSRGPDTLSKIVERIGRGATAGTKREAADCELVVLATNWVSVSEALGDIDWKDRILVDGSNAHKDAKPDLSADGVDRSLAALAGRTSSEIVADMAAGAKVVKAISHMPMAWMQDFSLQKPRSVMFASGDHPGAKRTVLKLIESAGFCAIDLGPLANGALQQVGGPLSGVDLHFVRRIRRG